MSIGWETPTLKPQKFISKAQYYALLLKNTILPKRYKNFYKKLGQNKQKTVGLGEDLWQLRLATEYDSHEHIDWRRSARDNKLYIKEYEKETFSKIFLWADLSQSMHFQSKMAHRAKAEHALLLLLTLAEFFTQCQKACDLANLLTNVQKDGAQKIAQALSHYRKLPKYPDLASFRTGGDLIIISDFLHYDDFFQKLKNIDPMQHTITLIEIIDPAEEHFPYEGAIDFKNFQEKNILTFKNTQAVKKEYLQIYKKRREILQSITQKQGWNYIRSHTDDAVEKTFLSLYNVI